MHQKEKDRGKNRRCKQAFMFAQPSVKENNERLCNNSSYIEISRIKEAKFTCGDKPKLQLTLCLR